MNKYFLIVLAALMVINLRAADQSGMDIGAERKVTAAVQADADFKAAQAMQTEEDAKPARPLLMGEVWQRMIADRGPIHTLEFNKNAQKQVGIIKQAIESGLHPDQCAIIVKRDISDGEDEQEREFVLNYAYRTVNSELMYYLLNKGATKLQIYPCFISPQKGIHIRYSDLYKRCDEPSSFYQKQAKNILDLYLSDCIHKLNPAFKRSEYFKYARNPHIALADLVLGNFDPKKIDKHHRTLLIELLDECFVHRNGQDGRTQAIKVFSYLAPLFIKAGVPLDPVSDYVGHNNYAIFKGKRTFDQSLTTVRKHLKNSSKAKEKILELFDGALKEIEKAKKEIAETRAGVKNLLADQEHLRNPNLAKIVEGYLDNDVLCDSLAAEIAAKKDELNVGLVNLETQYQAEIKVEQERQRLEQERIKELERKRHIEEWEKLKRETGIDFDANEQLSIGNFNPGELSFGILQDDFDGFGLTSNSHNGMRNSSYTQYQPMMLNAGANGMSQSSSSHNGLSSSSHNGSQSSSSNADWLLAHNASQSSSSHNGLSNAAHNGMQLESDVPQSQSSSSSDAPHGKGEKRKLDDDDNRDGGKRAKKE